MRGVTMAGIIWMAAGALVGCHSPASPSATFSRGGTTALEKQLIAAGFQWAASVNSPDLQQLAHDPTVRVTRVTPVLSLLGLPKNYYALSLVNSSGPCGTMAVDDAFNAMGVGFGSLTFPDEGEISSLLLSHNLRATGPVVWVFFGGDSIGTSSQVLPVAKIPITEGVLYITHRREVFIEDPNGPFPILTDAGWFRVRRLD